MWIKTSELEGAALDWAVAQTMPEYMEGFAVHIELGLVGENWAPPFSTDWSQGGPLIDELVHSFNRWNDGTYEANVKTGACTAIGCEGGTILIAAMRAIVASELGDEVDVPEELLL